MWTTDKNKYILIKLSMGQYSIFNLYDRKILIIEDDEEEKIVIKIMINSGNKVIRKELLKYLVEGRPLPAIIRISSNKFIYRCPDNGEQFELSLEDDSCHIEPEFDLAIKWDKDMPITNQINALKRIVPDLELSNQRLLQLARENTDYIFAKHCSHYKTTNIINDGRKKGLHLYVVTHK
jgi:hypothetical protein